jgi:hypothetical protein
MGCCKVYLSVDLEKNAIANAADFREWLNKSLVAFIRVIRDLLQ